MTTDSEREPGDADLAGLEDEEGAGGDLDIEELEDDPAYDPDDPELKDIKGG